MDLRPEDDSGREGYADDNQGGDEQDAEECAEHGGLILGLENGTWSASTQVYDYICSTRVAKGAEKRQGNCRRTGRNLRVFTPKTRVTKDTGLAFLPVRKIALLANWR
jgi:hypothetical protein